jgi:hypothetical protein
LPEEIPFQQENQLAEDKVRRLVAYLETVEQDDARSVDLLRASSVYEPGSLCRYPDESYLNARLSQEPTEAKGKSNLISFQSGCF